MKSIKSFVVIVVGAGAAGVGVGLALLAPVRRAGRLQPANGTIDVTF